MTLDLLAPMLAFGTLLAVLVFGVYGVKGAKDAKQENVNSSLSDE